MTDNLKRIVVKVGTSTLSYPTGGLNIRRISKLISVLSDFKNSGMEIVLVSSGAIGAGTARLKLGERPKDTMMKQAAAAVGQCELMHVYDKLFMEYGYTAAQILMTRIITNHDNTREHLINTFNTLLKLGAIPIVNENDSVAVEEIESEDMGFGGNDMLSAVVANLIHADMLILLSDIKGLYDSDPHKNPDAKLITCVTAIDDNLRKLAGGAGSSLGTGGMVTKLDAAEITMSSGIDMIIADGSDPELLYDIIDGKSVGTLFKAAQN